MRLDAVLRQNMFESLRFPPARLNELLPATCKRLYRLSLATPAYLRDRRYPTRAECILDVGCGTGVEAIYLAHANPEARVVGLDFYEPGLEIARRRSADQDLSHRVEFVRVEAGLHVPSNLGGPFDLLNVSGLACFVQNLDDFLAWLATLLRPSGVLRITFHNLSERIALLRAQRLLQHLGVERLSTEAAVQYTRKLFGSLGANVPLRRETWQSSYDANDALVLSNQLLFGDRGHEFDELLDTFERSAFHVIDMVDFRNWSLDHLVPKGGSLHELLGTTESIDRLKELRLYALLAYRGRQFDFFLSREENRGHWCARNEHSGLGLSTRMALHPVLRCEEFLSVLDYHIKTRKLMALNGFVPDVRDMFLGSEAVRILQACEREVPVEGLLDMLQGQGVSAEASFRMLSELEVLGTIGFVADASVGVGVR